jgi:hypothetical protein
MAYAHALELSLVSIQCLDIVDIFLLSRVSRSVWTALRSLTEIRCLKAVDDGILQHILDFFRGLKLLSLNAEHLDWSMMYRIFDHSQVSLLRLDYLSLYEPPLAIPENTILIPATSTSTESHSHPRLAHIRRIDLLNCRSSGSALEHLLTGCQNLENFHLHGSLFVRDQNIDIMLLGKRHLVSLDFSQLLGIQRLIITKHLQKSLKTLSVTKCSFLRDILLIQVSIGCFQSLAFCDLSSTAVNSECVARIVVSSPRLERLVLLECASIIGSLILQSQSLREINLQQCFNLEDLTCNCPNLSKLNVLGCLNLKKLTINSSCMKCLDISMLSQLHYLKVNCLMIAYINFSGCRKLTEAKILSGSSFGKSLNKLHYRRENITQPHADNDIDFLHFGCSQLSISPLDTISSSKNKQLSTAKLRRSQFSVRSSSI